MGAAKQYQPARRRWRNRTTKALVKMLGKMDLFREGLDYQLLAAVTIIPFIPDGWAASAGGFPAMVGNVAFTMKDVVLFAISVYLLKQDLVRVLEQDPARASLIAEPAR